MKRDYNEKIAQADKKGTKIPPDHSDKLGSLMAAQRARRTTIKKNRRTGQETISVATTTTTVQLPDGMTLSTKFFNIDGDPTTLVRNITIADIEVIDDFQKIIKNADGTQFYDKVFIARWTCIVEGTEELIEFEEMEV